MLDTLFADSAAWFALPALLGTGYLVISLVLDQLGGGLVDDAGLDGALDGAGSDIGHGADFSVLSLQSISAFLCGGGWMGVAALKFTDLGFTASALVAIASGVAVGWGFTKLMRALLKLQRSGNISIANTKGLSGTVYIEVPPANQGRGRVQVVVQGRRREFDATQRSDTPIPRNTSVRVIDVRVEGNAIEVEPRSSD